MPARNPLTDFVRRILLLETPYGDIHDRHEIFENFTKRPLLNADILITATDPTLAQMALIWAANPNWEVSGTNMTSALCTFSAGGGITLTTAGADEDQAILGPHTDTDASGANIALDPDDQPRWEALLDIPQITACSIHAGLKLTSDPLVATDADSAYFLLPIDTTATGVTASANWHVNVSVNGTDTTTDLGSAYLGATGKIRLGVTIGSDLKARFYINGTLVHTAATAFDGGEALKPFVSVEAGGVAAKAITVRWERINRVV